MREAVIAEVSTQLSEVVGVIERHLEPTLLAVHLYGSAVDGGIIGRQLLVGSSTKIHFLFGESQTIKKDTSFPLRGNQSIGYDFLIFLISLHILKRDPTSPPTCCL